MKTTLRKMIFRFSMMLLFVGLTAVTIVFCYAEVKASGSSNLCVVVSGTNEEEQDYSRWASPECSALTALPDGRLMSVTRDSRGSVVIMYFNSSYTLTGTKRITPELPVYGGFFASSDGCFYLATGQDNPNESDDVEVYRITKYDGNWNELGHASLFGANTESPYLGGSCDFAESDRYLLVRTCHRMYQSDDGLNHQANVTIQIDKTDMNVTGSHYWIANSSVGYVSHSFNQFIVNDNGYAVAVDHGDGCPRSIVIGKYTRSISEGICVGFGGPYTCIDAIRIPGNTGANDTGVSVGGFEYSDSAYLIAVNMVNMSGEYNAFGTRNAAVAVVPKSGNDFGTPVIHTLTNYSQGEAGVSTPRLVKTGKNSFLMLWSRNGTVYYTQLDGNGNPGSIYSFRGSLSDCNPVVYNGNVVWYVYNDGDTDFYTISLSNISQNSKVHIITGHNYVYKGTNNGVATMVCDKCGDVFSKTTASSITVFGRLSTESGYYSTGFMTTLNIDQEVQFLYRFSPEDAEDTTLEVIVDNEDVMVYNPAAQKLTPLAQGTTTVTFRMKYNPTVQKVYTFTVLDPSYDPSNVSVTGITLNYTSVSIKDTGTYQLTATVSPAKATNKGLTWTSSNTAVATVDSNGLVRGVSAGTTTITAKATDGSGKQATCTVTVTASTVSVTGITLNSASASIKDNGTYQLTATVSPANATNKGLTWTSSNTSVATVDSNGLVKGVSAGTTTITAKAKDGSGKQATCTVTVTASTVSVTGITLNYTSVSIKDNGTYQLTATVSPANATNKGLTWTSSNTSVATVDSNGLVKGVSAGTATITAKAKDGSGKQATCTVTVTASSNPSKNLVWEIVNGKAYWYENNVIQGTYDDHQGILGFGTIRGREIYDAKSGGWYWLDSVYNGAKAEGKEVWIPYIYQEELALSSDGIGRYANGISDEAKIHELAQASNTYEAEMADQVEAAIRNHTGKWVRYDENGAMLKGWVTIEGTLAECYPDQRGNVYYYDQKTGLMAKGWTRINGVDYYFDEITGVLQK